ncbi:hypothetical protein [Candidatus Amarobacter glycogenicus]|uniref:hypothetical protein n=1 Tax=Candidatus Amarobacter glycogenicus TaxID=3140699 RepID=UPI0031CC7313
MPTRTPAARPSPCCNVPGDPEIIFSYKIEQGPKTAELTIAGQKREIYNDTIIGYSSNGKEVVRVTVDEPLIERPDRFAMDTI